MSVIYDDTALLDTSARIAGIPLHPALFPPKADNVYYAGGPTRRIATGKLAYEGVYSVRAAGEVIQLSASVGWANPSYQVRTTRGRIREFSQQSRRRLARTCAAIPWGAMPFSFLTLTYPDIPVDGRRCVEDLKAFRKRWERKYGAAVCVWKREFQRRGSTHYHLAILTPSGVPLVELRRWVALNWFQVVQSGNPDHLRAGTAVEPMRQPPTAYFASHGQHGRDQKGYQNEVPEFVNNPGRFWGTWNCSPLWDSVSLTGPEFVQARRILRAWARSRRMYYHPQSGRVQGFWLRSRSRPGAFLMVDLLRAVRLCST